MSQVIDFCSFPYSWDHSFATVQVSVLTSLLSVYCTLFCCPLSLLFFTAMALLGGRPGSRALHGNHLGEKQCPAVMVEAGRCHWISCWAGAVSMVCRLVGVSQQWEEGEQQWEVMRVGCCKGLGCALYGGRDLSLSSSHSCTREDFPYLHSSKAHTATQTHLLRLIDPSSAGISCL